MLKRIVNFEFGEKESDYTVAKIVISLAAFAFFLCLGDLLFSGPVSLADQICGVGLSVVFLAITFKIGQSLINLKD